MAYTFFAQDTEDLNLTVRASNGTAAVPRGGTFQYGPTPALGINGGFMVIADALFYAFTVTNFTGTNFYFKSIIGGDDSGNRVVASGNFANKSIAAEDTSALLSWTSVQSGIAYISWGPVGGPYSSPEVTSTGTSHSYTFSSLSPETYYEYMLGLEIAAPSGITISGANFSYNQFITTPTPIPEPTPLNIPIGSFASTDSVIYGTESFGIGSIQSSPNYISADKFMDDILK